MNKIATLLAPLALAAATLVPSFANAAAMPTQAPVTAQATVAKATTPVIAKWGHERIEVRRPEFRQPVRFYPHPVMHVEYGMHGRFERGARRW